MTSVDSTTAMATIGRITSAMTSTLRRCILVIALAALPIVAIAVVLRLDVIKFAYMRGRFDLHSAQVTAGILMCYVGGVPAFGLRDFLNRVFHSLQDTKAPFRVSCLVVGLNIALNLILRIFLGATGLALATSIAGTAGMITLLLLLKKRFKRLGFSRILPDLAKIVAASLVCAAVCALLDRALPPAMGTGRVFVRLVACTAASMAAYIVACGLLRVRTVRVFASEVLRRRR